jgi:hypothetical protein
MAKIAEIADDFLSGLNCWAQVQVEIKVWGAREISEYTTTEAQVKRASCLRTGTGAGVAQIPKFNGSTS